MIKKFGILNILKFWKTAKYQLKMLRLQEKNNFLLFQDMAAVDVEGGTVIEVPVSYTDLQGSEGQAFVLQEAEDDTDEEVDSDPDFDPNDLDFEEEKKPKKKGKPSIDVEKCSICGATVSDLAMHIVNAHSQKSADPIRHWF